MKIHVLALAFAVPACSAPSLPALSPVDAASIDASAPSTPYQPVLAGTAPHGPAELKPWRVLNDSVAPGGRKSP